MKCSKLYIVSVEKEYWYTNMDKKLTLIKKLLLLLIFISESLSHNVLFHLGIELILTWNKMNLKLFQ